MNKKFVASHHGREIVIAAFMFYATVFDSHFPSRDYAEQHFSSNLKKSCHDFENAHLFFFFFFFLAFLYFFYTQTWKICACNVPFALNNRVFSLAVWDRAISLTFTFQSLVFLVMVSQPLPYSCDVRSVWWQKLSAETSQLPRTTSGSRVTSGATRISPRGGSVNPPAALKPLPLYKTCYVFCHC